MSDSGDKSWLMETAYVRCRVLPQDPPDEMQCRGSAPGTPAGEDTKASRQGAAAAPLHVERAAPGVPFMGPMVVELLGPGWLPGGRMEFVSVGASMVAALWQVLGALGIDAPAVLRGGDGAGLALLRVRVLRLRKGGLGSGPVHWAVCPCGPAGEWLEGAQDFCVDLPESWLVERGVSGDAASVKRGAEAVVAVAVEAVKSLEAKAEEWPLMNADGRGSEKGRVA